ncbi:ribosome biogenesis GTPase Der [Nitrospirillum sp. BR 11164]|uniref:ribosome biogenesis GTPase Der n=1 Tax=Nitrospirillum sp. BR 11164 TaxID=3104324 RepID=UPI002AFDF998|nr:ribosome biogenesis GTPase Der [Nitrospirillum sp. BR 11164]MEA1650602.1 ribosome biogenesis GTPase Der [Nitrospirillum sp. BR 11164]
MASPRRLTVAIIGRPNVGKSTLFNRLAGKKLAIVDDTPGVTRDWRSADGYLAGIELTVVDTAGLEEAFDDSLEARMRRQTERAIERADVGLFIVDARAGITPLDRHFAAWLRKGKTPIILVANKCEGNAGKPGLMECYELGLGDPVPLSAEHGEGMADLVDALTPYLPPDEPGEEEAEEEGPLDDEAAEARDNAKPLQLAIVGRPNVGKSTLLNSLLGEERVLTGPEAGMTRDAIAAEWTWRDRPVKLVDTAGLRRRARVEDKLEKLAVADTLRVVRMAHVVVLVLDADAILDKQDLTIARQVIEEGRGLVIAVNKWDAVANRAEALQQLSDRLETSLPQVRGIPTITISALKQQKLDVLLDAAFEVYRLWNRRIPTAQLNRWLQGMLESHPPPLVDGRRLKIRYMTQVKARPPTFALFSSRPVEIPEHYTRYLINGLRETFKLPAVPLRFLLRKGSDNPFD